MDRKNFTKKITMEEGNGMTAASRLRDHDLLVKVDTKMDALTDKVNDLANGTAERLTKLETWKETVDNYHASIDLKYYKEIASWAYDFKSNLKIFLPVLGLIYTVLSAVIVALVLNYLKLAK